MEHELRIATRWPDFDALGHLNHAVYHVYCDEARDAVLRATVGDIEQWPNVVVHATIDYREEIPLGTREVVVRTRIVDVGRSSVRFVHDVGDGAAEVSAVLVAWDPRTRRSREITVGERDALLAGGVVTP
jgi:YbgC/YbaW family acyl-CoA thioester hydrolase